MSKSVLGNSQVLTELSEGTDRAMHLHHSASAADAVPHYTGTYNAIYLSSLNKQQIRVKSVPTSYELWFAVAVVVFFCKETQYIYLDLTAFILIYLYSK